MDKGSSAVIICVGPLLTLTELVQAPLHYPSQEKLRFSNEDLLVQGIAHKQTSGSRSI